MHLNKSNGYWYVRRNNSGGKETVAKLGKHKSEPSIYRPELHQDKAENILSRLPDESVDLILSDPPYGIDFSSGRDEFDGAAKLGGIFNDKKIDFLEAIAHELQRVLKPDSHCYIFTRWDAYEEMANYFDVIGERNTVLVWNKIHHGMGDLSTWAPQHEWVLHYEKGDPKIYGKRPSNVLEFAGVRSNKTLQIHPTQKPLDLSEFLIEKSSQPGDVVFDPFGGAYTTARAAMRTFRKAVSCELNPETHRAAEGLVEKQLHDDPVFGIDWTEVSNLKVEQVDVVEQLAKA